jgi:hypothetical protein
VEIFLASRVTYILAFCASPLWGAGPVRVYLVASLVWVAGRYGFSLYWLSFGVCLCDLTGGGVAGQYDFSSIFCFVLAGQYD